MGVERIGSKNPYRTIIDRVVIEGQELAKAWRGVVKRVEVPGIPNAFITVSSLYRGVLREYEIEVYVTKPGNLTDKEQGDLAKKASDSAYSRMMRARTGDFS